MKLLPFRSRARQSPAVPEPGRRMRIIGIVTLVVGCVAAGLLYWLETRNAEPSLEELMPGYSRANSRMMGIYYGHAGQMMWEWRETLARPDTQAAIILVVAAIVAAGCFRVAFVDAERAKQR